MSRAQSRSIASKYSAAPAAAATVQSPGPARSRILCSLLTHMCSTTMSCPTGACTAHRWLAERSVPGWAFPTYICTKVGSGAVAWKPWVPVPRPSESGGGVGGTSDLHRLFDCNRASQQLASVPQTTTCQHDVSIVVPFVLLPSWDGLHDL